MPRSNYADRFLRVIADLHVYFHLLQSDHARVIEEKSSRIVENSSLLHEAFQLMMGKILGLQLSGLPIDHLDCMMGNIN